MAYGIGVHPDTTTEHSITSPRSSSNSTISSAYNTNLVSAAISPSMSHGRLSASAHFSDPTALQVSAPSLAHAYTIPSSSLQYQQAPQEPIHLALSQLPMTSQPSRGSLDFSFIESSPVVNPPPGHAQPIPYQRPSMNPSKSQASNKHDIR